MLSIPKKVDNYVDNVDNSSEWTWITRQKQTKDKK